MGDTGSEGPCDPQACGPLLPLPSSSGVWHRWPVRVLLCVSQAVACWLVATAHTSVPPFFRRLTSTDGCLTSFQCGASEED